MSIEYKINQDICTECNQCVRSCPSANTIIKKESGLIIDTETCIKCGHCAAVCSNGAITCNDQELPLVQSVDIKSEDIFNLLRQKRSVRIYHDKVIADEIINDIIDVASFSATASNNRTLKVSVLKGEEVSACSKLLSGLMLTKLKKISNPVFRFLFSKKIPKNFKNPDKLSSFCEVMQATVDGKIDRMFFKAPVVVVLTHPVSNKKWGRVDCSIAATNATLYAESLGLNSCVVGFAEGFNDNIEARKSLKIPKNYIAGSIFVLGYGKEKYFRIPKRERID